MNEICYLMPITLRGDNLGVRHRYFNALVRDVYEKNVPLEHILRLPEWSPIDVLFKVDLASKHRNVDFIIKVLKGENMLYVSRALKSNWLLHSDYKNIINPVYLESQLYPHMITPAVNKMKHWLQNNLKDAERCQQFYEYYDVDFNTKIKFLHHCRTEFVMKEFLKIMNKVTPKQLKILCEYCPKILKLYYDNFSSDMEAMDLFLKNESKYMDCCRYILKTEPDIFFEVVEKYYDHNEYKSFTSNITDYIMSKHRERFLAKPELYAAWLLHKETVVKYLDDDQAKDLVLCLARAEYLNSWFSFKNVEPYIKRIKVNERTAFKKRVFVDKDIGDTIKDWAYQIPCRPKAPDLETIFDDLTYQQLFFHEQQGFRRLLKKRKYIAYSCRMERSLNVPRTLLDELFDKYRFDGFEKTFFFLQKRLKAESSVKNREFIMLVLISKCGENMEHVEKLLRFLVEQYKNESTNLRATIVRSFVVRACIWRLSSSAWGLLQDFARGLGIDGVSPIICREGMHAAFLRVLLSGGNCSESLRTAFLEDFSYFTNYKLSTLEKRSVRNRLPAFLLTAAIAETDDRAERLQLLLDTLFNLKMPLKDCPGALEAMIEAVRRDTTSAQNLLIRMYNQRIGRRELIKENFDKFNTDESYLNVLRHDANILRSTKNFEEMLKSHSFNYDGFLRKLSLYFGEPGGLVSHYTEVIKNIAEIQPHVSLARPLVLVCDDLAPIIEDCMKESKVTSKKQFGNALRSNYYIKKLAEVDALDWKTSSAKAIINRVILCKTVDVTKYLEKSLQYRRTLKLALLLAERGGDLPQIYDVVKAKRPGVAIRSAISYFKRNKFGKVQVDVWRKVAPALENIDLSLQQNYQLQLTLQKGNFIPSDIEAEYWTNVSKVLQKGAEEKIIPVVSKFEYLLPEIGSDVIEKLIEKNLESFTLEALQDTHYDEYHGLQIRIIAKYLLLSKSESEQKERIDTIWWPFFDRLSIIFKQNCDIAMSCLERFVSGLKYNKAFFDTALASSIPVFQRIVTDLRKLLPMERYLEIFVTIHAIMLYRQSIEQVLKKQPEVFKDVKTKRTGGARVVGQVYGKLVGYEVKELRVRYFKTVINLYQEYIMAFLRQEFFMDSESRFLNAFIKGLIDTKNTEALQVAEYMLNQDRHTIDSDPEKAQLLMRLKESDDKVLKFLLYADFFSGGVREAG